MLRSPRDKFFTGPHKAAFEKIVLDPAFEEATLAALIELQQSLPSDPSPNQAADSYNQMLGARRLLDILVTLHHPPTKPPQVQAESLNWSAGV